MSFLDLFEPIYKLIPEIKAPEGKPAFKTKLLWTLFAVVLFFIMGHITLIGLEPVAASQLVLYQQILASNIGTLITVGIGPIVLASIILQLLVGGQIINVDLSNPADKLKFQSFQKVLALFLCFFEAAAYSGFGIFPGLIAPLEGMFIIIVIQIAFGSIILMYLDEIVSKFGLGSGISLFIAGGVTGSFAWKLFAPSLATPQGLVSGRFWSMLTNIFAGEMALAIPILIAILFAIVIFLVVVFAEGVHINIPITLGKRGIHSRFPVKFLYVSNMPVILASALFANVQIWASITKGIPTLGAILAGVNWMVSPPRLAGNMSLIEGIVLAFFNPGGVSLSSIGFELFHAAIYIGILVILCVIFGRFWIEMGNQGPEAVAKQLQRSGMSIPGFRNDPRIIRGILERYIPPISILGGAFVGLLAGVADMTLLSLSTGTGILLTVGIVYRLYEQLAKEAVLGSNVLMKKLFG